MRRVLTSFRAATGLGCEEVPPRTLNELPDPGVEALIDFIMLIEQKCEWPNPCNRIVFMAKAAGGCDPSGSSSPSYACSAGFVALRQSCGRPPTGGFLFGPRTRAASSAVSGSRQPGVNGPQPTGMQWQQSSVSDLLKAFDHVAYQKLIDALPGATAEAAPAASPGGQAC